MKHLYIATLDGQVISSGSTAKQILYVQLKECLGMQIYLKIIGDIKLCLLEEDC